MQKKCIAKSWKSRDTYASDRLFSNCAIFGWQVVQFHNSNSVQHSCNKIILSIKRDLGISFFISVQQFTALQGKQSPTYKSCSLAWTEAFQMKTYVMESEWERARDPEMEKSWSEREEQLFSVRGRYPFKQRRLINSTFLMWYKLNCEHEILAISFPDDWNEYGLVKV